MKNVLSNFKEYSLYFGMFFMTLGLTSCSDDDDGVIDEPDSEATGTITASDQTLSGNTIVVQSVIVGQDSWLAAVRSGEEDSDNFIAGPERIEEGTESDVSLTLNADADLETDENGAAEIVLKLYADDDDGIWDVDDEPITDESGVLATQTITITTEESTAGDFSSFDENEDGSLDQNEVSATYQNDFTNWDADGDGSLNEEEFSNTTFANTDSNNDEGIDEDEWNTGNTSQYSAYSGENTFADYDTDASGTIDSDEWMTGYADSEWYSTYDADASGSVTEDEWDTGLYNDWDTDADGTINEDEYNNYSGYTANWSNTTGAGAGM